MLEDNQKMLEEMILKLREKMPEGDTVEEIIDIPASTGVPRSVIEAGFTVPRRLRVYFHSGESTTFFDSVEAYFDSVDAWFEVEEDPYIFEIKGEVNTTLLKGHVNMDLPQYSHMADTPWEWKRHIVLL